MSISIDKPTLKDIRSYKKSLRAHLLSIGGYLQIHLFFILSCFKINYFFKDSDSEYVNTLKSITNLPLVANLRNGLWQVSNAFIFFFHVFFFFFYRLFLLFIHRYNDPQNFKTTCYFKSTDGHVSQWKFSLSRLNLHVAILAAENQGQIYSQRYIYIYIVNPLFFFKVV